MKNQVIKVVSVEHAKKIKEYFKYLGYDIEGLNNPNIEIRPNLYYGVINGKFNDYSVSEILRTNAEIVEIPTSQETSTSHQPNKKKRGRPKTKVTNQQKPTKDIWRKKTNSKQEVVEPITNILHLDFLVKSNGETSINFQSSSHEIVKNFLYEIMKNVGNQMPVI